MCGTERALVNHSRILHALHKKLCFHVSMEMKSNIYDLKSLMTQVKINNVNLLIALNTNLS